MDEPTRCPACRSANVSDFNSEGRACCRSCLHVFTEREADRHDFLSAWDNAVDSPRYEKRFWRRLWARFFGA